MVDDRADAGGPRPRRRARACPWSSRPTPTTCVALVARSERGACRARACPTTTRCSPRHASAGVPVLSEFDLARRWDDRPLVAITGTDGKTTVTELARAMLEADGRHAVAVGNTEVPLVAAIDDPTVDVFVVEASSFRLLHSHRFAPDVGTWLNLAPDHLDPASAATPPWRTTSPPRPGIWADQARRPGRHRQRRRPGRGGRAGPRSPPARSPSGSGPAPTTASTATGSCSTPATRSPRCGELHRAFPHDLANALAAAATVVHAGGSVAAARERPAGLPGAPPSGHAGGRGWRGALVRRLEGHRAPRHPCRRPRPSPRSC